MENSLVLQLSNKKFKDFYLCFCGYSKCNSLHNFGPAVRPNYIIHYILSGKGYYYVDDKKYTLEKNNGFLIEPNLQTFYEADSKDPWSYIWIGFSGELASEYLYKIGLNYNNLTFKNNKSDELKEIILKMLNHNESSLRDEFYLQGLLYQFFSYLLEDTSILETRNKKSYASENLYIRKAIEFIKNNYSKGIMVTDIANHLSISRSYLYILFDQILSISPKDYLTNFCITRASELLILTEYPIESIALSCGYKNPEVFSVVFKSKFSLTPTKYRKANRKEKKEKLAQEISSLNKI